MGLGGKGGGVAVAIVGLLAGLALLAGYGEAGTPKAKKGAEAPKAPAKTTEEAAKKPWADRVFDIYVAGFKETAAALEKVPPAAEALPKLKAIRDKAIEALVPLGREREAMDAAARAQADAQLGLKMSSDFYNSETYKAYAKLHDGPYNITKMRNSDEEKAFQRILAGMNTITQYACFELLKKQEPKEAERLGIK
jgi:hypothetical protein